MCCEFFKVIVVLILNGYLLNIKVNELMLGNSLFVESIFDLGSAKKCCLVAMHEQAYTFYREVDVARLIFVVI